MTLPIVVKKGFLVELQHLLQKFTTKIGRVFQVFPYSDIFPDSNLLNGGGKAAQKVNYTSFKVLAGAFRQHFASQTMGQPFKLNGLNSKLQPKYGKINNI